MALTPIVIPRRNIVAINNSSGAFQPIPGTVPFIFFQNNNPYFALNLNGSSADLDYAGAFLRADGSICGIYNPDPVIDNSSGSHLVSLKPDLSDSIVSLAPGTGIVVNHNAYMSGGVVSPNTYDLGPVGLPTLIVATPFFSGTLGYNLSWGYIGGWGALMPKSGDGNYFYYDVTGTYFNAFSFDSDFNINNVDFTSVVSDGIWNYTFSDGEPISGTGVGIWFSKWQPAAYNLAGPFTYTNYEIVLGDTTDNADWQSGLDYSSSAGYHLSFSNGKNFCVGLYSNTAFATELTLFLFASDMSYYDRYNVTLDGSQEYPIFFIDYDDNFYIISYDTINNVSTFAIGLASAAPGIATLGDVISLGCWSPCANLLYQRPS
jgi:hypothetical protein